MLYDYACKSIKCVTQRPTTTADAIYDAQFTPVSGTPDKMKISTDRAQIIFQSTLDDSTSQLTTLAVRLSGQSDVTPPFDILSGDRLSTQLGWYELQIDFGAL